MTHTNAQIFAKLAIDKLVKELPKGKYVTTNFLCKPRR